MHIILHIVFIKAAVLLNYVCHLKHRSRNVSAFFIFFFLDLSFMARMYGTRTDKDE